MKKGLIGLILTLMLFVSGGCFLSNKEEKSEGILGVYKFDRVDVMHTKLPGFVEKTTSCSVSDVTEDSLLEEVCSRDDLLIKKELEIELKENYEATITFSIEGFDEYKAKTTYEVSGAVVLNIALLGDEIDIVIRGNEILIADVIEGTDQSCPDEASEGEGSTGSSCVVLREDRTYYFVYKKA